LKSEAFKKKIDDMMTSEDNPNLVQDIRNLLTDAANQCKIKKTRKRTNFNEPWFDEECRNLKNSIKSNGKALRRNPNDITAREKLYIEKRKLRNLIKKNKFLHRKSIVSRK
jgi:hypothetical protein